MAFRLVWYNFLCNRLRYSSAQACPVEFHALCYRSSQTSAAKNAESASAARCSNERNDPPGKPGGILPENREKSPQNKVARADLVLPASRPVNGYRKFNIIPQTKALSISMGDAVKSALSSRNASGSSNRKISTDGLR